MSQPIVLPGGVIIGPGPFPTDCNNKTVGEMTKESETVLESKQIIKKRVSFSADMKDTKGDAECSKPICNVCDGVIEQKASDKNPDEDFKDGSNASGTTIAGSNKQSKEPECSTPICDVCGGVIKESKCSSKLEKETESSTLNCNVCGGVIEQSKCSSKLEKETESSTLNCNVCGGVIEQSKCSSKLEKGAEWSTPICNVCCGVVEQSIYDSKIFAEKTDRAKTRKDCSVKTKKQSPGQHLEDVEPKKVFKKYNMEETPNNPNETINTTNDPSEKSFFREIPKRNTRKRKPRNTEKTFRNPTLENQPSTSKTVLPEAKPSLKEFSGVVSNGASNKKNSISMIQSDSRKSDSKKFCSVKNNNFVKIEHKRNRGNTTVHTEADITSAALSPKEADKGQRHLSISIKQEKVEAPQATNNISVCENSKGKTKRERTKIKEKQGQDSRKAVAKLMRKVNKYLKQIDVKHIHSEFELDSDSSDCSCSSSDCSCSSSNCSCSSSNCSCSSWDCSCSSSNCSCSSNDETSGPSCGSDCNCRFSSCSCNSSFRSCDEYSEYTLNTTSGL